ncbi:MAG: Uma2 family endonuclease [Myxococcales bacterium]|nr:Uma2 family endonuclease [Myxococcales bacterium]
MGGALGQSQRHLELCFLLFALLKRLVAPEHSCGADQFVYWNARTNRRQLAPDGFVKLGVAHEAFNSWKTWEKGIPELAVEILSPSDTPERWTFEEELERYHELGVRELVCFNMDGRVGERLRVWDLIEGDLVERIVEGESTPCLTLSGVLGAPVLWAVAPFGEFPAALRLMRDGTLVPTAEEERDKAEREAKALTARVAELEAKLRGE